MKKNFLKKIIVLGITIIIVGYAVKNIVINRYYSSSNEAYADSISSSEDDFKFDAATGTITKYIGNQADVVIPGTINGETVTSIGVNAFLGCSNAIFYLESEKTKELLLKPDSNSTTYIENDRIVIK